MSPLPCSFSHRIASPPGLSLIDYPGKVAVLVFFRGCNFRCPYCHNHTLLELGEGEDDDAVTAKLLEMKRLADALVVTGGEPTWGEGLLPFIETACDMGYNVKLDTNGSAPDHLEELLGRGLVSYVAMDLKHTPEKYREACGVSVDTGLIRRSAELILKNAPEYEFRTTLVPGMHTADDVAEIIRSFSLEKSRRYVLQQYVPREGTGFPAWTRRDWTEITAPFRGVRHIEIREEP